MSQKNDELTEEQKVALDAENERRTIEAFRFLSRHPYLKQDWKNANLLAKYLEERSLDWSVESLEEAYDELESQLIFLTEAERKAQAAAALEKEKHKAPPFPWGEKLTNVVVAKMDRADFKKYLKDPQFRRQLNELGIKA